MERFAMLAAAVAMLVFASPAMAQTPEVTDVESPESVAQGQYEPNGPQTQQAVEEGIEDAIEDAQQNNAAVDGTGAYIGSLSPEEAEAAAAEAVEAEESVAPSGAPSASVRYQSLPDTGGAAFTLPFAGALAMFLAGGMLMWRK